jgi:hypothetical protein
MQTNMENQIFNDKIMQLTWHINKHGCNIYAWVQLSKWKVENNHVRTSVSIAYRKKYTSQLALVCCIERFFQTDLRVMHSFAVISQHYQYKSTKHATLLFWNHKFMQLQPMWGPHLLYSCFIISQKWCFWWN